MEWMKILNKGWINVIQALIIVMLIMLLITCNGSGNDAIEDSGTDTTGEAIESLRNELANVNERNNESIRLLTEVIEANTDVIGGLTELSRENRLSRDIVSELGSDNIGHTQRIREVQDQTLENELTTDGLKGLIRQIERENDYNQ